MRGLRVVAVLAGAVALLALTGCASRGSVRQLESEVAALKDQVGELRKAQEASTRELARTVGELKALDSQLSKTAQGENAAEQQVARVEARLAETEEAVRGLRASLDGLSRELVRQVTAPTRETPAEPERPGPRSGPAEQLYAAALASFRAREHGQAVLEFTDFIARYPRHPLVPNAQFWIAEAYYLQRDYRQALAEYEKVTAMNGKAGKAPDALLKIGLCFRALNEPNRAREIWQQLLQAYPDSEAARQARALIGARAVPIRRAR